MCVPGRQGRASTALLLATLGSPPRLGGTGDLFQRLEVPPGVGAAGSPGQRGWGTPSCWVVGDGFQGAQGALVANPGGSSPQTVADPRHTFSQRLPAGVQGPQTGFGESVTPPPHQKIVQSCVCVHVFLVGQGWSVALIRFLESSVSQRLGTPGWGCTFSRGQCGQGRARRDVSIPQSLLASGSLI